LTLSGAPLVAVSGGVSRTGASLSLSHRVAWHYRESGNEVNVARLYPSEAYVTLRGERRKAMADQLSAISKRRLRDRLGRLDGGDVTAVERAICVQLGL